VNTYLFYELANGDPDVCRDLIEHYMTQTTQQIRELKQALSSDSASTVSRIAHSMAGASLMVGIDSPVSLLRKLEEDGDQGDLSKAASLIVALDKEFKEIFTSLKKVGNG